jgi:hypothetical protein
MKLLEDKKIKIGDKEYLLKMSIRTMMRFETLSGHSIGIIRTLEDVIMLFYCSVKSGGIDITYDQFIDLIDDKIDCLKEFSAWAIVGDVEKK